MHLLGTPARSYYNADYLESQEKMDKAWFRLRRCDKLGYRMAASSHGQGEVQDEKGIISGHAYSLVAVKNVKTQDGGEVRLCQMRNPWGSVEWTGDWSDGDNINWTPELRERYGCKEANDGTFHIPFEQYLNQYAWTSIAVDDDVRYNRYNVMKKFNEQEEYAFFEFEVQEDVILQKTSREHPDVHDVDFGITVCQQGDRLGHYRAK